ncbi:zinc metalloprotease HtpX [Candidatus Woesearchaeota archaeon]|nr:zinc metalloprotease HtpX [Candidatus Woesearchaeota archaeon]
MINQIKTAMLLGALTGLMLLAGNLLGGRGGLTIALVFAGLMNFGAYFFSDKIVLAMYRAQEAKKTEYAALHRIIEEIAHKANVPKPKVYIIETTTPNAFATGRNPKHAAVACTTGIMSLLTHDELKGVLAHEISHVKNRDILITTIAATIAGVISYLAQMAQFAAIFGGNRDEREGGNIAGMLVLAILTPIIATIIQLAISRSREYHADATGAKTIHNSHHLANALKKIETGVQQHPLGFGHPATSSLFILNPFSAQGFVRLLSTHPPTNERIKRLNEMKF